MTISDPSTHPTNRSGAGSQLGGPALLGILLLVALTLVGCPAPRPSVPVASATRDAAIHRIAADYARDQDLSKAQSRLESLELANAGQLVLVMTETDIREGRDRRELEQMAALAAALGARSAQIAPYLALPPTPQPPTAAPATARPSATPFAPLMAPSPTPSPTSLPATATPSPAATNTSAPTATPTLSSPYVQARNAANLRGGPGTLFPVVGELKAGARMEIIGRNASGDWWQLDWKGSGQAWISGTIVSVLGPIDTIAVAKTIPTPPPTSVPAPTAPPAPPVPTAAPKPAGANFRLAGMRLWGVVENGGSYDGSSVHCGFSRVLHVFVRDAGGNLLNGVTVKALLGAQEEMVSGSKGPGMAEFVLGGGQNVIVVRDTDGRAVSSDTATGITTDPAAIPDEVLIGAGYCKDAGDCARFRAERGCFAHYSWDVTFQRAN